MLIGKEWKHYTEICIWKHSSQYFLYRGEEPQVLDYQTQQEKLFPLIAASYALMFTGNIMVQEYTRINQNIEQGNMEEMQVVSDLVIIFLTIWLWHSDYLAGNQCLNF